MGIWFVEMHHTLVTWSWVANARASGSKVPFEWAIVSMQPLGLVPDACAMAFAGLWRQRGPACNSHLGTSYAKPWCSVAPVETCLLQTCQLVDLSCWYLACSSDWAESELCAGSPILLVCTLRPRIREEAVESEVASTNGGSPCWHWSPDCVVNAAWKSERARFQRTMLHTFPAALCCPCKSREICQWQARCTWSLKVKSQDMTKTATCERARSRNSGTGQNQERICLGGALWVRLLNHIYGIFVVMRLCSHLLHTCCTPFSQLMWLTCFPGSQLAAGACACWLVSWAMSAPCWTFSVCCRRFWPLSSIADLAASVTACSLARICLVSSKMIGRYRQIIAFGAFDLNHEAWSWQMQINAEVHAAKTIQDPITSESQKTNSKIQNTTSVAQ